MSEIPFVMDLNFEFMQINKKIMDLIWCGVPNCTNRSEFLILKQNYTKPHETEPMGICQECNETLMGIRTEIRKTKSLNESWFAIFPDKTAIGCLNCGSLKSTEQLNEEGALSCCPEYQEHTYTLNEYIKKWGSKKDVSNLKVFK